MRFLQTTSRWSSAAPFSICVLLLIPLLTFTPIASADPPPSVESERTSVPVPQGRAAAHRAQTSVRDAARAGERMLSRLAEARRIGDRRRIQCADRSLSQINSFRRMIETQSRALAALSSEGRISGEQISARQTSGGEGPSAPAGRSAEIQRRLAIVARLGSQLSQIEESGHLCAGDAQAPGTNQTVVVVTIDPDVPHHRLHQSTWPAF